MTQRYALLPLISFLLKLSGYVMFAVALILPLVQLVKLLQVNGLSFSTLFTVMLDMIKGLVQALLLLGASEIIHVLISIEENTRRHADAATGQVTGTTPRVQP